MFFTNQQYKRVLVELPLSNDTGQPGKTSPISEGNKRTPQLLTVIQGLLHVRESVLNNIPEGQNDSFDIHFYLSFWCCVPRINKQQVNYHQLQEKWAVITWTGRSVTQNSHFIR